MKLLVPFFILGLIFTAMTWKGGYILAIVFGFFAQGLVEYVMHRYLYHKEPSDQQGDFNDQYRSHIGHHEFPNKAEFLTGGGSGLFEVKVGVGLALFYAFLLWPFLSIQAALQYGLVMMFIGHLASFFFYEYCHTLAHLKVPKGWFGINVTRSHLAHHYQDHDVNFHVSPTAAWVDWIFGTPLDKQKAKEKFDRETILSLGLNPMDARLVIARKTYGLPEKPGIREAGDLS